MTSSESGVAVSGSAFFIVPSSDFQDARVTSPDRLSSDDGKKKPVNTRLYKTNLCRTFSKLGTCPYGMKCQFAHGEAELRPVPEDLDDKKKLETIAPVIPIFSSLTPVALRMSSPMTLQSTVSAVDISAYGGAKPAGAALATAPALTIGGFSFLPSSVEELQAAAAATRVSPADIPLTLADLPILDPGKKLTSMSTSSPRVTMLSLGPTVAEKPIPEGARVDCDPKMYKTELCRSFSRTGVCRYGAKCQFAHGIEELRPAPVRMRRVVVDGDVSKETEAEEKAAWDAQEKVNESLVSPAVARDPEPSSLGVKVESVAEVGIATPIAGTDSPVTALRIKDDDAMPEDEEDRWGKIRPESATARLQRTEKSTVSPKVKDPRVYKTELCKKFESTGVCPYGLKCQFAHGKKELRSRIPFTATAAGAPEITFPVAPASATASSPATSPTRAMSPDAADSSSSPTSSSGTDLKLYKTELCRSFTKSGYCRYGLKCQFAHGIQELRPSPRLVTAAARLGMISVDVTSSTPVNPLASEFGVLNDTKFTTSSPRRLVGSPVIASPKAKAAGSSGFSSATSEVSVPSLFGKGPAEAGSGTKTDSPRVSVVTEAFSFALPIAPHRSVPLGSDESAISAMSSS